MPVARYLFYVGGVLLALLFIADACLPKLRAANGELSPSVVIRIHSDRKWPERIVLDTSRPTIVPAEIANAEADSAAPTSVGSAATRAREAFALQPADAKHLQSRQPEKLEPKPQRQSKIARKHAAPRMRLVARPPRYGWFGYQVW
jgi:hypothetical protein